VKINLLQMKPLLLPNKMIKIKKGEQDKDDDQDQDMDNDQEGFEQNEDDEEKSKSSPLPHPRVRQIVERDHLINNILGAIEKGVTTRSRVAIFCEYYLFVSSFEPFKVEDALRDPDFGGSHARRLSRSTLFKFFPNREVHCDFLQSIDS
jgi:hypothetical protein